MLDRERVGHRSLYAPLQRAVLCIRFNDFKHDNAADPRTAVVQFGKYCHGVAARRRARTFIDIRAANRSRVIAFYLLGATRGDPMSRKRVVRPVVDRALQVVEAALDEPTTARIDEARTTANMAFELVSTSCLPAGEATQIMFLATQLRAMLTAIDRRASALHRALRWN
jgi:hypothetical protein